MTGHVLPIGAQRLASGTGLRLPLCHPSETNDSVLRVLLRRAAAGSRRGDRGDQHLAVSPGCGEMRVLSDLRDPDEVLGAVRASCSVPLLSGAPQQLRGESLVDGGFLESLPYGSALREGATHVLVLRSRAADYRLGPYPRLKELTVRIAGQGFVSMLRARPQRYNREAEELADAIASLVLGGGAHQLTAAA